MHDICSSSGNRSGRLLTFGFGLVAAIAYLTVGIVRGDPWGGVGATIVLAGYGIVLWFTRNRSETTFLLGGARGDERQAQVGQQALAITAQVMITVTVIGAIATFASNSTAGAIFSTLAAVGAVTFVASMFWLSRRDSAE